MFVYVVVRTLEKVEKRNLMDYNRKKKKKLVEIHFCFWSTLTGNWFFWQKTDDVLKKNDKNELSTKCTHN